MKKILFTTIIFLTCIGMYAQNCVPNTSCLQFTGTSTYVDISSSNGLNITDSITIEAWVYANAWGLTSAQNSIVCKHGWYFGEEGYVLRAGGTGELSFNIACDSAGTAVSWREVVSSTNALQLNTWHHVVGQFTGTESRLYIDGNLAGTRSFGATVSIVPSVDYSMKIGKLADDNQPDTRFWDGRIDEVRVWHRVLSQTEIAQNMSHHIDPATAIDLVGYWRFNENTGTSVADLGTGANNGTVVSGTWSTTVPFNEGPAIPLITIALPNLYSSSPTGNQWYLNGSAITGATASIYQPAQNGSYTVVVTDSNGCTATSPPVVMTTLGIDAVEQSHFVLQSGEIHGKLLLGLPENELRNAEVRIMDAAGRIALKLERGNVGTEIPLNQISSGLYFIYLTTTARQYTEKIIVR